MDNNNQKKPSSLGFNLFVDEDMADLFLLFSNLYLAFEKLPEEYKKESPIPMAKSGTTFDDFVKKINDPIHKLGWCKDPDCKYESGPDIIDL